MSKSYEEVVHGLRSGPRFKNQASEDLESLARELLNRTIMGNFFLIPWVN